ncbi:MAG TPA: hypothetical protein VJ907_04675 [Halanaerobiales bacterium]|nr:hypothetical protein [Halanaerobiales bacterium]
MNLSDLKNDVYFLTGTDSSSYVDDDIERNINRWYRKAVTWIWESISTWQYDDTNKSTLPIATTDMRDDQEDYSLPSGAQNLMKVEVKNKNGDWYELDPIDVSEVDSPSEYYDEKGTPQYYDLMGNSIILYPAPDENEVTTSQGLKIHISRDVDALSDSTDVPGFDEQFHRILSLGAALDWCIAFGDGHKEVDIRRQLEGDSQTDGLKKELKIYYGRRNKNRRHGIKFRHNPNRYN